AEHVLAKDLAPLELRRRLAGAENLQFLVLKGIDDSLGQRRLGTDHRQPDVIVLRKANQPAKVVGGNGHVLGIDRRSGIAGSDENPLRTATLLELPGERMFTPAVANNQNVHIRLNRPEAA